MKKAFGFLCLFLLIGFGAAAFMYLANNYSTKGSTTLNPGNNVVASIVKSRKLKEFDDEGNNHVSLEDYRHFDPVPSSKASIRPGPIQHSTPLMPYIPKHYSPPPTAQPKHGG